MKVIIKCKEDIIRLRNLFFFKLTKNSSLINKYINYDFRRRRLLNLNLQSIINIKDLNVSNINESVDYVAKMTLEHRFNILGSGWVYSSFDNKTLGLLGYNYDDKYRETKNDYFEQLNNLRKLDKRVLKQIPENYNYICWNKDIKTGYRWKIGYLDENKTTYNLPDGVDIKNVWELGRMNFLSSLALYALKERDIFYVLQEYKNIVMDFYISNPVGIGVNWILPMEAAIRISNILFSFDILSQIDIYDIFDNNFKILLKKMILQHIKYIYQNQEKNIVDYINRNHYYSNISGLLFASSYVKSNKKMKKVYSYAVKEFIRESVSQFYDEGGHFEKSTNYLRLVGEMFVFGISILQRNNEVIPDYLIDVLIENRNLTQDLTKNNLEVIQVGDSDDGRFIKANMFGVYGSNYEIENSYLNLKGYCNLFDKNEIYFDENTRVYTSFIEFSNGILFEKNECKTIESEIINSISNNKQIADSSRIYNDKKSIHNFITENENNYNMNEKYIKQCIIDIPEFDLDECKQFLYKSFGIYGIKSKRFSFYFLFGNNNNINGHAHNDSLHVEFEENGKNILFDCGTFTYTAIKEYRNLFRLQKAHCVPIHKNEQKAISDVFSYKSSDYRTVLKYSKKEIKVLYQNDTYTHIREIKLNPPIIEINDISDDEFEFNLQEKEIYSTGYGKLKINNKNEGECDEIN